MGVIMQTKKRIASQASRVSRAGRIAATLISVLPVFLAFIVFPSSSLRLSADEASGAATTKATASEVDYLAEYEAIFYDSYDGLVSAQINAVAQTGDGFDSRVLPDGTK